MINLSKTYNITLSELCMFMSTSLTYAYVYMDRKLFMLEKKLMSYEIVKLVRERGENL